MTCAFDKCQCPLEHVCIIQSNDRIIFAVLQIGFLMTAWYSMDLKLKKVIYIYIYIYIIAHHWSFDN